MSAGASAIGRAIEVSCPRCESIPQEKCREEGKPVSAPHVERGRLARWVAMGIPILPKE